MHVQFIQQIITEKWHFISVKYLLISNAAMQWQVKQGPEFELTKDTAYLTSTHWGQGKKAATFADDTFKYKFVNENVLILIKI